MTSLQNLQAEAREKAFKEYTHMEEKDSVWLDELVSHIYTAALQEALGKVPGESHRFDNSDHGVGFSDGHDSCRTETIQGIESLIPKKDI